MPENQPRCLVFILDLYLSKLPLYAFQTDTFYFRPKAKTPSNLNQAWYDSVPVGKNKLSTVVKEMSIEAGLKEKKTNHSLRATGATALFSAGVPERIIQQNTGHRSLEALRQYERISVDQQQATSRILTTLDKNCTFNEETSTISKNTEVHYVTRPRNLAMSGMFDGCSIGSITVNINQGPFRE